MATATTVGTAAGPAVTPGDWQAPTHSQGCPGGTGSPGEPVSGT